jgi:hypothetical protein
MYHLRKLNTGVIFLVVLALVLPMTMAAASPVMAGQPNRSCEDVSARPGHSATARGSAFNPDGISGTKYAGEQPQNSNNPHSVSQYDVACYQLSIH